MSLALAGVLAGSPAAATDGLPAGRHVDVGPLRYERQLVDGHQLLAYDERGDGRIAEVLGNPDTADRIAVVVPGSGHALDNFWVDPSTAAPRRNGLALLEELRRQGAGARTAVVVWTGYDTPEQVDLNAVRSDRATPGARDLARLTHALPARARITLVGHSYGSVVCGLAAGRARISDLVALGSPGMDAGSAVALGTDANVWATRTPDDPIRFAPNLRVAGLGHSTDPTDSEFGARIFDFGGIHGHDHYYRPGSESLRNIARIVLGRYSAVTVDAIGETAARAVGENGPGRG